MELELRVAEARKAEAEARKAEAEAEARKAEARKAEAEAEARKAEAEAEARKAEAEAEARKAEARKAEAEAEAEARKAEARKAEAEARKAEAEHGTPAPAILKALDRMSEQMSELRMHQILESSSTVALSKIREDQLDRACAALNLLIVDVDVSTGSLAQLFGADVAEGSSAFWDAELSEPSQRAAYAKRLCKHLPKPPRCYEWVDAKSQAVSAVVGGMKLSGKNDELLILRANHSQPDKGCLLGIELKKRLSQQALRQARGEFILFSHSSLYPFVQLVTDLERGGVAYFCERALPTGQSLVAQRVLAGMDAVWAFLASLVHALPAEYGAASGRVEVPEPPLRDPGRIRLPVPRPLPAATMAVLEAYEGSDVARLSDLRPFFE